MKTTHRAGKLRLTATALALALMGGGLALVDSGPAVAAPADDCNASLEITHSGPSPAIEIGGSVLPNKSGWDEGKNEGPVYFTQGTKATKHPNWWNLTIKVPNDAKAGQVFSILFSEPFAVPVFPLNLTDETTGKEIATLKYGVGRSIQFTLSEGVEELNDIVATLSLAPSYAYVVDPAKYNEPQVYEGGITDCKGKEIGKGTVSRPAIRYGNDTIRNSWHGQPDKPSQLITRLTTAITEKSGEKFTITVPSHPQLTYQENWGAFFHRPNFPDLPERWTRMQEGVNYTTTVNSDGSVTLTGTVPQDKTEIDIFFAYRYKNPPVTEEDKEGIPSSITYFFEDEKPKVFETLLVAPGYASGASGVPADAQFGEFVFIDENENGVRDEGEPLVPGVKVKITGNKVNREVTTNKEGKYESGDLRPGDYNVTFFAPKGYKFTQPGKDSVVDAQGKTTVSLKAKDNNLGINAGLVKYVTSLKVKKTADVEEGATLGYGTTVNWTYTVTNNGNANAKITSIVDNQGVKITCPKMELAPNETVNCTGSGQVK